MRAGRQVNSKGIVTHVSVHFCPAQHTHFSAHSPFIYNLFILSAPSFQFSFRQAQPSMNCHLIAVEGFVYRSDPRRHVVPWQIYPRWRARLQLNLMQQNDSRFQCILIESQERAFGGPKTQHGNVFLWVHHPQKWPWVALRGGVPDPVSKTSL